MKRTTRIGGGATLLLLLLSALLLAVSAASPQQHAPEQQEPHSAASYTPEYRAAARAASRTQGSGPVNAAHRASAALAHTVRASTGLMLADAFGKTLAAREARVAQSDNVFDMLQHGAFTVASKLVPRPSSSSGSAFRPLSDSEGMRIPVSYRNLAGGFSGTPDFDKFELTDDQKASVLAEYGTDSKALKMRDQSPRFGPSKMQFTVGDNDDKDPYGIGISSYVWGVALCFIIGIGIAFFQLFLTGLYMCLRVCVWRWCCKKRSDHEKDGFPGWPTSCKKYWPVVSAFVCIALACAFAAVGIVFNNGVSQTFSTSNQEHGVAPLVLNAMDSLDGKINAITTVLDHITNDIPGIRNAIVATTNSIGGISTASADVNRTAMELAAKYASPTPYAIANGVGFTSYSVTVNGSTWYCDITCSGLGYFARQLGKKLDENVNPVFNEFQSAINDVNDAFLDVSDDILDTLRDARSAVGSASSGIADDDAKKQITDNSGTVSDYDKYRNIAFVVLFSVVFITPVLSGLAVTSKKGWPFKCQFCLGPFYLFLIWLLFGLHWMLGMFIGDACVYMDDSLVDLKGHLVQVIDEDNAGTVSSVINACLVNASLVTALNLTDYLDFANLITFPEIPSSTNISGRFDALDLATLNVQAAGMDASHFRKIGPGGVIAQDNYNFSAVDDPLKAMYNVVSQVPLNGHIVYTRADLVSNRSSPTPSLWYTTHYTVGPNLDDVLAAEAEAWDAYQIESALTDAALALQFDAALLVSNVSALENYLTTVVSLVSNTSNPESVYAALEPLFSRVHEFEDVAYCGFIADIFGDFKSTLCDSLGNSIQFITLSLFIIGLSCFGITWFSRWSSYRVQFVARIAPMPFDENAWMQQAGGQPAAGGVQMAVMDDGQQQQHYNEEQGGTEYGGYTAGTASVGAGEAAYGDAVQVPPYQAALAAYNSQQNAEGGETGDAAGENAGNEAIASPSAPAAPAGGAEFPFGPCESCQAQPAMVTCVECDEKLCMECDNSLHMIVANAQHDRTMMA